MNEKISAHYFALESAGKLRPLHQRVVIVTDRGRIEGTIVGRTISGSPKYDIMTRLGRYCYIEPAMLADVPAPRAAQPVVPKLIAGKDIA